MFCTAAQKGILNHSVLLTLMPVDPPKQITIHIQLYVNCIGIMELTSEW